MNLAFEELRKVVPEFPGYQDDSDSNSKLTKITTLRLAVNYIAALTQILKQTDDCDADQIDADSENLSSENQQQVNRENQHQQTPLNQTQLAQLVEALSSSASQNGLLIHRPSSCGSSDLPSCNSPSTAESDSLQSLESLKSSCWPDFSAEDSLDDAFDLILESDGESMQLDEDLIT